MPLTDEEILLQRRITAFNSAINDLMRQRDEYAKRVFEIRNPPPSNAMIRLACRHLDPTEGTMHGGHRVDDSDVLALRKVLDYAAAKLKEDDELQP